MDDVVATVCPVCVSMNGPTAVRVFALLIVFSIAIWGYLAYRARRPHREIPPHVDPYALAAVRFGPGQAMHAALAGLIDRELVHFENGHYQRVPDARPGRGLTDVEHGLWEALTTPMDLHTIARGTATQGLRDAIERRIDATDLRATGWRAKRWRLAALLLIPVAFGTFRIVHGLHVNRPVEYMFIGVAGALLIGGFFALYLKHNTPAIDPRLNWNDHTARVRQHMAATSTPENDGTGRSGLDPALLILAIGSGITAQSLYSSHLQQQMGPILAAGSNTGSSWASCGTTSSCGGDSGGSSCGGGGCGGCGSS